MEENNQQVAVEFAPPKKQISMLRTERFGKIFSNMVFTCGPIILLLLLSSIIMPVFQLVLLAVLFVVIVCMVVFTLGSIFVIPNSPIGSVWNLLVGVSDFGNSMNLVNFCVSLIPYFSIVGLVLAGLAITMLCLGNSKHKVGRIIAVSIIAGLMALALIVYYVLGGALWQGLN